MIDRARALRWSISFGAVLAAHLGGGAALLAWRMPLEPMAPVAAVLLDLTPDERRPTPPADTAQTEAPAVIDTETLARLLPAPEPPAPPVLHAPDRLADALPAPEVPPEVVVAPPPPPPLPPPQPKPAAAPTPRKPEPARKPVVAAKPASEAPAANAPATAPTAPSAGAASQLSPDALRRWQTSLLAHLQRHKRYPGLARNNNEQGVVYLRFTMNRGGAVIAKAIERGSGHASLDSETLALIDRAQPLPQPPADIPGERFEFVVPVQFQLR